MHGLSVVIATWPDTSGLASCLEALAPQVDSQTEVLVAAGCELPREWQQRFPWVAGWLLEPSGRLIPHLWGAGITRAQGEIVALTTAQFVPAPGWLHQVREAHVRLEARAIGGPIEPSPAGRSVDWATYLLRYSAYLADRDEQAVKDLAGDNASYKRSFLRDHAELLADGFWEIDWHRLLRQQGRPLIWAPRMRVTQQASFGFWPFLRQRFLHGQHFGRWRFPQCGRLRRLLAASALPLIPCWFLGKIAGRVVRDGRYIGPLLRALPALWCFLLAWSLGEAWGYLHARR